MAVVRDGGASVGELTQRGAQRVQAQRAEVEGAGVQGAGVEGVALNGADLPAGLQPDPFADPCAASSARVIR